MYKYITILDTATEFECMVMEHPFHQSGDFILFAKHLKTPILIPRQNITLSSVKSLDLYIDYFKQYNGNDNYFDATIISLFYYLVNILDYTYIPNKIDLEQLRLQLIE